MGASDAQAAPRLATAAASTPAAPLLFDSHIVGPRLCRNRLQRPSHPCHPHPPDITLLALAFDVRKSCEE
jgi:hypothetical protein